MEETYSDKIVTEMMRLGTLTLLYELGDISWIDYIDARNKVIESLKEINCE